MTCLFDDIIVISIFSKIIVHLLTKMLFPDHNKMFTTLNNYYLWWFIEILKMYLLFLLDYCIIYVHFFQ